MNCKIRLLIVICRLSVVVCDASVFCTWAQPLGGQGGPDLPKIWTHHPQLFIIDVKNINLQIKNIKNMFLHFYEKIFLKNIHKNIKTAKNFLKHVFKLL